MDGQASTAGRLARFDGDEEIRIRKAPTKVGAFSYTKFILVFNKKLKKLFIAPKVRQKLYETGFCDFLS